MNFLASPPAGVAKWSDLSVDTDVPRTALRARGGSPVTLVR